MSLILRLLFKLITRLGSRGARIAIRSRGTIRFVGLVARRPLASLTHGQINNALQQAGLRVAHNSHFIKRLVSRGPQRGIHTLDDFARAFNNGVARPGTREGTIDILFPGGRSMATVNSAGELITFIVF